MKKGGILLVRFPFSDLSGSKIRPSVALIADSSEVTVAFVSTQINRKARWDISLHPDPFNGLKAESFLRLNKLVTIHHKLVFGRLGSLNGATVKMFDQNLISIFKIQISR